MNNNQAFCVKCGVLVGNGNTYCANCGKVRNNTTFCTSCGYQMHPMARVVQKPLKAPPTKMTIFFFVSYLCVAVLTTVFMAIPDYFWNYYNSLTYSRILSWSFIEFWDVFSIIPLLLLWANPTISLIRLNRQRKYSLVKLINSSVLLVMVLMMTFIDSFFYDGFGSMFFLVMLFLLAQLVLSIIELVRTHANNKATKNNIPAPTVAVSMDQQPPVPDNPIFCRNCGVKMNANQGVCIKCGVSVGNGNSYCANCGEAISENADFCVHCGVVNQVKKHPNQKNNAIEYPGGQDKTSLALFCFFLGGVGVHNFIMGKGRKVLPK